MEFEYHLEANLIKLHDDLRNHSYIHGQYSYFSIFDSKKRDIYKASMRDRVVHQMLYQYLVFLYEPEFIAHSYASRVKKGAHRTLHNI